MIHFYILLTAIFLMPDLVRADERSYTHAAQPAGHLYPGGLYRGHRFRLVDGICHEAFVEKGRLVDRPTCQQSCVFLNSKSEFVFTGCTIF